MATFHLQKDGKNFQVDAESREAAIAKVQAFFAEQQETPPAPEQTPATPPNGAPPIQQDLLGQQIEDTSELLLPGAERTQAGIVLPDGRTVPEGHPDSLHPSNPQSTASQRQQTAGDQLLNVGKGVIAAGDIGTTLATGAVAEPVAGLVGLAAVVHNGIRRGLTGNNSGDVDAANMINWVSDALTWEPKTQGGKQVLRTVAVPLMRVDAALDDFIIDDMGIDNPAVAAGVKTLVYGALEVGGIGKLTKARRADSAALKIKLDELKETLDSLRIKPTQGDLFTDVVDAAGEIAIDSKGAAIPVVRDALIQKQEARKAAVNAKFEDARRTNALIETDNVVHFSRDVRDLLIKDGFEVGTGNTADILEKLRRFADINPITGEKRPGILMPDGTRVANTAADLKGFETIRRNITRRLEGMPESADRSALISIKTKMDDFLDDQLLNDLVTGNQDAIGKWKEARELHSRYVRDFKEDKFIVKMMDKAATPEELVEVVLGAGQFGKAMSSRIIKRMDEVLGPNNPVKAAMNQELQFRLLQPLLDAGPTVNSMKQFRRKYDNINLLNSGLVEELGLDTKAFKALRDAAETASKLPNAPVVFSGMDFSTVMSRIVFGNKLAKATLRVNFVRGLLRSMVGKDRISQKQILADIAGIPMHKGKFKDDPDRFSSLVAPFAAAEAIHTIQEAERDRSR